MEENSWQAGDGTNVCANRAEYAKKDNISNLYVPGEQNVDAPRNKENKWNEIFGSDRYLKCKGPRDIKTVKIFEICKWNHCDHQNSDVYDDGLFIGRVQINMNNGTKRRFLYFQADYQLKN